MLPIFYLHFVWSVLCACLRYGLVCRISHLACADAKTCSLLPSVESGSSVIELKNQLRSSQGFAFTFLRFCTLIATVAFAFSPALYCVAVKFDRRRCSRPKCCHVCTTRCFDSFIPVSWTVHSLYTSTSNPGSPSRHFACSDATIQLLPSVVRSRL